MRLFLNLKTLTLLFLLLLSGVTVVRGQGNLSIGGYFGGGVLYGNFPGQGSFTSSLYIQMNPGFSKTLEARLGFFFISDYNSLLPETQPRPYPFIKGYSLKAVTSQLADENLNLYIEEGLGPVAVNDRTFGNNTWDYGVAFSLGAGIKMKKAGHTGIMLGAGTEYGLTFTNTSVSYLSVHLEVRLLF
jgi:hypothetical protein